MGELQQREDIIEYPENYEDMKKKYLEREEEGLKKALARRKAETADELKQLATTAIVTRAHRIASDQKPLKDRTILREAKNEDIKDLKKRLSEEIDAIGRRILQELRKEVPSLENKIVGLKQLKGRITQTPPKAAEPEKFKESPPKAGEST